MNSNRDKNEVESPTTIEGRENSNMRFCEQMGEALVNLGTTEALSCMARMMCAIAHNQGVELEFECDLGSVVITPKSLPQVH